jgi:hypothetical protein
LFLIHVLILKAEKHRFPRCKHLVLIWIQVIVVFNFIYICSCYIFLCWARNLPPPPPAVYCTVVHNAAILMSAEEEDSAQCSAVLILSI